MSGGGLIRRPATKSPATKCLRRRSLARIVQRVLQQQERETDAGRPIDRMGGTFRCGDADRVFNYPEIGTIRQHGVCLALQRWRATAEPESCSSSSPIYAGYVDKRAKCGTRMHVSICNVTSGGKSRHDREGHDWFVVHGQCGACPVAYPPPRGFFVPTAAGRFQAERLSPSFG